MPGISYFSYQLSVEPPPPKSLPDELLLLELSELLLLESELVLLESELVLPPQSLELLLESPELLLQSRELLPALESSELPLLVESVESALLEPIEAMLPLQV